MITKQDDLLGTLIHDVAHLLRHDIDRRLKSQNLTRVKWLALGIISKKPHLTQRELAEEMELGDAAVGRLVDRLADRGFVEREDNPEDRRAYRLTLSSGARALLADLEKTGAALRKDLLKGFEDNEISALNQGLSKLKNNLKSKSLVISALVLSAIYRANFELNAQIATLL